MIGYFDGINEGELIYSSLSRCYGWFKEYGYRAFTREMFGRTTVSPTIEFQSNLSILSIQIGGLYSPVEMLEKSTLYSLYKPFLYRSEQEKLKEMMLLDGGLGIKGLVGFLAGSICKKDSLYYCPMCAKEDVEAGINPYFRVVHQMQGVTACSEHGVMLKRYPIKRSDMSRIEYLKSPDTFLEEYGCEKSSELDVIISQYFKEIYEGSLEGFDTEMLFDIYRKRLKELGHLKLKGDLRVLKFEKDFRLFYGDDVLKRYESEIISKDHSWHRVLVRDKKIKLHPLRHVLMIHFLFGSINGLINFSEKVNDVKCFPCLNRVSAHYGERLINDVTVTYDYKSRIPVGNFKCPECGFHYSRKMQDDEHIVGRVKGYGPVWMKALELVSLRNDLSLREKARRMHCDPKTIIKYSQ